MSAAEHAPAADAGTLTDATTINRSVMLPTRSEDASLINCREVEDWCRQCRDYRTPILTATAALVGSSGLFVGFLTGLASTARPGWHALFLGGLVATGGAIAISLLSLGVSHSPAVRNKLRRGEPAATPLQQLADHMDRAMRHNKVPSGQSVDVVIAQQASDSLAVVTAEYGKGDRFLDITDRVVRELVNGRLTMIPTNEFAGQDPVPGVVKELVLTYEADGQRLTRVFSEGEPISLP